MMAMDDRVVFPPQVRNYLALAGGVLIPFGGTVLDPTEPEVAAIETLLLGHPGLYVAADLASHMGWHSTLGFSACYSLLESMVASGWVAALQADEDFSILLRPVDVARRIYAPETAQKLYGGRGTTVPITIESRS